MQKLISQYITQLKDQQIFTLVMILFASLIAGAIVLDQYYIALLPFLLIGIALVIYDYRILYALLIISLPISQELYLPNGLGTDLPSEPLMLGVTGIAILYFLDRLRKIDYSYLYHSLSVILLVHIAWTLVTCITAQDMVVGTKFLLAKLWYVIPFYFFPFAVIRNNITYKSILGLIFFPLFAIVIWVLVRHAGHGFSFATSNTVVYPIFRNHVSYASLLVLLLPFLIGSYTIVNSKFWKRLCLLGIPIMIIAIYFSYTRAAQGSILIAAAAYIMFRLRLAKPAIAIGGILAIVGCIYLVNENKYLDYAPNYDSTITHYEFDNLIEATYKLEDISTMERVHRWVAGGRMIADRPWLGFGPGNFYNTYKDYTLNEFKTYVSHNPEKSGIHNYFLMLAVEQGIIGSLIFILLLIVAIFKGEKLYHQLKPGIPRTMIICSLVTLIVFTALSMFNDMVETDKVGPIFFFCISTIVLVDIRQNKSTKSHQTPQL